MRKTYPANYVEMFPLSRFECFIHASRIHLRINEFTCLTLSIRDRQIIKSFQVWFLALLWDFSSNSSSVFKGEAYWLVLKLGEFPSLVPGIPLSLFCPLTYDWINLRKCITILIISSYQVFFFCFILSIIFSNYLIGYEYPRLFSDGARWL